MPRFYHDLKFWVFLGILAGLGIGFDAERPGDFLMVALILQMTVSLEGLVLRRSDMSEYRGSLLVSLLCGFGINTLMTLFMGSFFIGDKALWYGWVVLASVPCGISLIAEAIFNEGDVKFSFLALTVSYFVSLLFTPFLTYIIIGEAADPLVILKYIVLFLAIPFAMTFPLRKVGLGSRKTMLINFFTFFIVSSPSVPTGTTSSTVPRSWDCWHLPVSYASSGYICSRCSSSGRWGSTAEGPWCIPS